MNRRYSRALVIVMLMLVCSCASQKPATDEGSSVPPNSAELVGTWTYPPADETECKQEWTFRSDMIYSRWLKCTGDEQNVEANTSGEWSMTNGRLVMVTLQTNNPQMFPVGQTTTCQVLSITKKQAELIDDQGQRFSLVKEIK